MKVRDLIRALEEEGRQQVRQKGSHRQFKHLRRPGVVTIAGKPGEMAAGTLNAVLKHAG